jgi:TldD protein
MFEILKSILAKVEADYADIRHEMKLETRIVLNGNELSEIGTNRTDGYVLRVLNKGGLSSVAFTSADEHERAIRNVLESTHLMSRFTEQPVAFAKTTVVKDTYIPVLQEDPRQTMIDEKLQLTRKYNNLILHNKKIATTNINYIELIRDKHYLSTEGSEIHEELVTTRISGLITSRDGNLLQNVRVAAGGSDGFAILRDREAEFENKTRIAVDLLRAQPIKGGRHNAIINQSLAGVFTHEAFGHFSEADIIENNHSMRQKMQIGAKLGNDIVSITDDPTQEHQLGHYKYDDEGVAARKTRLLENGVLVGRLHSRRSAAAFGEPSAGTVLPRTTVTRRSSEWAPYSSNPATKHSSKCSANSATDSTFLMRKVGRPVARISPLVHNTLTRSRMVSSERWLGTLIFLVTCTAR